MLIFLLAEYGEISGGVFIGGETTSCLLTSLSTTYSSNSSLISFPLKLVLKFFGTLIFKTGANVSLEPPVIVPLLAQPTINIARTIKRNLYKDLNIKEVLSRAK